MALIVNCPITGYSYKLPIFSSQEKHCRISALHPLCDCALEEINKIQTSPDFKDKAYLFVAYLWQVNDFLPDTINWKAALLPEKFTHMFLLQQIPRIKLLVNWLAVNSKSTACTKMPGFRVETDIRQHDISNWIDACFHIKETEMQPLLDGTAARIATKNAERDSGDVIIKAGEFATYQKNKSRKAYIVLSLSGHPTEKVELVTKVIFRTNEYDVGLIRAVKNYCLDFLLEDKQEHYYEKQEIINKLYKVIGTKITVAKALDLENDTTLEAEKDFNHTFTIQHKGKDYYNNILNNPNLAKLDSKLRANKPQINIPETEPQIENYDHPLKFKVAHNIWKRAQENATK